MKNIKKQLINYYHSQTENAAVAPFACNMASDSFKQKPQNSEKNKRSGRWLKPTMAAVLVIAVIAAALGINRPGVDNGANVSSNSEDCQNSPSETDKQDPEISDSVTVNKVYVTAPVYNGDNYSDGFEYTSYEKYDSYITEELLSLLEEHRGEDVWYTVFVDIYKTDETAGDPVEEVDEAFYNQALEYARSAGAENVISAKTSADRALDSYHCYYMDVTEETVYKMLAHGNYSIALARPRTGNYALSVTDYLTRLLENADEDDTFDVWVLTGADTHPREGFEGEIYSYQLSAYMHYMAAAYLSMYHDEINVDFARPDAEYNLSNVSQWGEGLSLEKTLIYERLSSISKLGYNSNAAAELYYDGVDLNPKNKLGNAPNPNILSTAEGDRETTEAFLNGVAAYTEEYMNDIITKAGIAGKINTNDYIDQATSMAGGSGLVTATSDLTAERIGRYLVSTYPALYGSREMVCWYIIPAFEAVSLTKAEILKLAEDDRVKAIYSTAPEALTVTLLPVSGYTPWV